MIKYSFSSVDPLGVIRTADKMERASVFLRNNIEGQCLPPPRPLWKWYRVRAKFQPFLRGPESRHLLVWMQMLLPPACPRDFLPFSDGQPNRKNHDQWLLKGLGAAFANLECTLVLFLFSVVLKLWAPTLLQGHCKHYGPLFWTAAHIHKMAFQSSPAWRLLRGPWVINPSSTRVISLSSEIITIKGVLSKQGTTPPGH